jgi:hypothetical protein
MDFGLAKEKVEINFEVIKIEPQSDDGSLKFSTTDDHLIGPDTVGHIRQSYFQ